MVVTLFFGVMYSHEPFIGMLYIIKHKMKASLDSGMREAQVLTPALGRLGFSFSICRMGLLPRQHCCAVQKYVCREHSMSWGNFTIDQVRVG